MPLSNRELAQKSGLSPATVHAISKLKSWETVSARVISKFTEACGINLFELGPVATYFRRRRKMVHLSNGSTQQKRYFAKLIRL